MTPLRPLSVRSPSHMKRPWRVRHHMGREAGKVPQDTRHVGEEGISGIDLQPRLSQVMPHESENKHPVKPFLNL